MAKMARPMAPNKSTYHKAALIAALVASLIYAMAMTAVVYAATSAPHTFRQPSTEFRVAPTAVLYPHFGAVEFWWDGYYWVIEQTTWLDKTVKPDKEY